MKNSPYIAFMLLISGLAPLSSYAQNQWSGYGSSTASNSADRYHAQPRPPHGYSQPRPPVYPQRPHVPPSDQDWGHISMKSGINIQYQAPTTIYHQTHQYSWVNGDPQIAQIESSTQQVITDWRRYGLPAPPSGSYWVFENGRYVLVKN